MTQTTINGEVRTANMMMLGKDTKYTKIFVGGLPYHTSDESLREHFQGYGDIEEAVVITDRQTGKSKGYGFVTMTDSTAADRACKDPNPIIDGRKANVNLAYIGAKPRQQPSIPVLRPLANGDLPAPHLPAPHLTTPVPLIYQSALTGSYIAQNPATVIVPSPYQTAYLAAPPLANGYVNPLLHPNSLTALPGGGAQVLSGGSFHTALPGSNWPYSTVPTSSPQITTLHDGDASYEHLVAQARSAPNDVL